MPWHCLQSTMRCSVTLSTLTLISDSSRAIAYNLSVVLTYRLADSWHIVTVTQVTVSVLRTLNSHPIASNSLTYTHISHLRRSGYKSFHHNKQGWIAQTRHAYTQPCYLQPNLKGKLDCDASALVNVLSGSMGSYCIQVPWFTKAHFKGRGRVALYCLLREKGDRAGNGEQCGLRAGPAALYAPVLIYAFPCSGPQKWRKGQPHTPQAENTGGGWSPSRLYKHNLSFCHT